MAAASKKVNALTLTVGGFFLLWMADWLAVKWFGYPFLYCVPAPVVRPFYEAWGNIANVICIGAVFFFGMRQKWPQTAVAMLVMAIVIGLPQYAEIMFKLDGSCG